jgi:hypothetical protein
MSFWIAAASRVMTSLPATNDAGKQSDVGINKKGRPAPQIELFKSQIGDSQQVTCTPGSCSQLTAC